MKLKAKEIGILATIVRERVPISLIIENRLGDLCYLNPFRDDKRGGSWHYSDTRQIYYDFASGDKGDIFSFIMRYDGVNYPEAILRAAYEGNLIDEATYRETSVMPDVSHTPTKEVSEIKKTNLVSKRSEENVDKVYTLLKKFCGLSQKHRSDLMMKRFISPEDIERAGYFTLTEIDMDKFAEYIAKYNYKPMDLIGIPGFYIDEADDKVKMSKIKGLAIPLYTPDGKITAIQIRRDKVKKDGNRYVFLSSSKYNMGCAVGTPVSTIRPKVRKRDDIFITEGQFKAMKLSEKFKAISLTIQGVNSTKGLDTDLPRILEELRNPRILIALDADMYENPAVKSALLKLNAQIESLVECPIMFVSWDEEYGKGVDDVINSGNIKKLSLMNKEEFYKRLGVNI